MTIKSIRTGWTGISALAGNPVIGDFESIQTVTVGSGGSATVSFTSIPTTYQHLQIRAITRTARTATGDNILWRFNSDSATNYTLHSIYGTGSGNALADAAINQTYGYYFNTTAASSTVDVFGAGIIDILDYKDTNKFKTVRTLHGHDLNGSGNIFLTSSLWRSTNAINSITLESQNAANIALYSHFALYGIR